MASVRKGRIVKDIDCTGKTSRVINQEIRHHIQAGETEICVHHPQARHNLGVAVSPAGQPDHERQCGLLLWRAY